VNVEARSRLLHLAGGFMITQAIGTVVRLGIPELVTERPRPAGELAEATGADPDALRRALRALASLGVFAEEDGVVRHTDLSELLQRDVPGSVEGQALLFSGFHYRTWGDAFQSFSTGEPAFPRVYGTSMWDWFDDHADEATIFNRAMAQRVAGRRSPLLDRDWSRERTVVDVGGGTGATLTALLAANPHLSGTIFDREHVREGAESAIAATGLGDRCTFAAGSFFEDVPAGADAYILSSILHDWGDEPAGAILRTCRAATGPDARLLLVEAVIEAGNEPDWMKFLDLHMLVALGGRERNEDEWRDLLAGNGFRLETISAGLLEAAPA
jgi:hypothetical protein